MKIGSPIEILTKLVEFPSITPDDAGSLNYIQEFITSLGGSYQRIDHNKTTNLIARIGEGSKIFAFAGHVDVVPTGDKQQWINQNPFKLHNVDGVLTGRGVVDMKGAIAAFMSALSGFVNQRSNPDSYQIMLLITSDEEGAATDGTIKMVEELKKSNTALDYCLIGEPTSSDKFGDTIKVGRRGSLTGELVVYGKQGHIAYPDLCENPIHLALPALTELSQIKWDNGNEHFPPTSLQFANLNSGLGVTNVIPGQLTADFNFRYNTQHTVESLQDHVKQVFDKYRLNYLINWKHSANPFLARIDSLVSIASKAIEEVCKLKPELKTDGGTSDGRFLIDISNELIEFGLLNATAHKINETTTQADLNQLAAIYNLILGKIFNG